MTQNQAYDILRTGRSVFLTGPAGSGKTFLLNKYILFLRKYKIDIGVTASTGLAAIHINGRTIHSWCGMGINETMTADEVKKLLSKEHLLRRMRFTKVLIIDEISMLNASRLDLVHHICTVVRQDRRPFGGMQVVISGDFFQLPPIITHNNEDGRFVTESEIWKAMDIKVCYLNEQHRHEDLKFISILNDIRSNTVTEATRNRLYTRLNKSVKAKIKPTKLYTHNKDVELYNLSELKKLKGKKRIFEMTSEGIPQFADDLKKNCLAYNILALKIGAAVMFIRNNFDKRYVNGTLGKVIGFDGDEGYPIVETVSGRHIIASREKWTIGDSDEELASVSQIPLRLAWAITVHKSQGMSLDCAEIDLRKTFEYGMGYVALSRVRTLAGLKLMGINKMALEVRDDVLVLNKHLYKKSEQVLKSFNMLTLGEKKKKQKEFLKLCLERNIFDAQV